MFSSPDFITLSLRTFVNGLKSFSHLECPPKCAACEADGKTCTACVEGAGLGLNDDGVVQCYGECISGICMS